MGIALAVALLIVGLALLLLEVFMPSFGVISIASTVCIVLSLYFGFSHSSTLGWSLVATAAVAIPAVLVTGFRLFPKTPLGRHMILAKPAVHPGTGTRSDRTDLVGKEGVARSPLRPSGVGEFDGERLDVITRGELVLPGTKIRIIESRGNRFVVRRIEVDETAAETDDD